jgi:hypothetical protein
LLKNVLKDPSFWLLIAINTWCIYYYERHPEGFSTIVWLYWIQSVLIGIFNFLDLLTIKNPDPKSMTINDRPMDGSGKSRGCVAFFFLFHYQFFHFVYIIFLATMLKGPIDFIFLLMGTVAFALGTLVQFIRHKRAEAGIIVNVGKIFFMPYLRIVPMHLMILGPAFLGWHTSTVFLLLKLMADALMYILTSPYSKPAATL